MALATYNNRKFWLGSLLLLTVLAAAWPMPDRESASSKAKDGITTDRHRASSAMPRIEFTPLAGTSAASQPAAIGDLFPPQTWGLTLPVVLQKPVAPPLPFTYGGRYTEGNNTMVFLAEGNLVHKVRAGDAIGETYKVNKIEPTSISLIYLPLKTIQILPTGGLLP